MNYDLIMMCIKPLNFDNFDAVERRAINYSLNIERQFNMPGFSRTRMFKASILKGMDIPKRIIISTLLMDVLHYCPSYEDEIITKFGKEIVDILNFFKKTRTMDFGGIFDKYKDELYPDNGVHEAISWLFLYDYSKMFYNDISYNKEWRYLRNIHEIVEIHKKIEEHFSLYFSHNVYFIKMLSDYRNTIKIATSTEPSYMPKKATA